ncbi:MAG: hypothetical protein AAFN74_10930 [Myxococcota bacterium]
MDIWAWVEDFTEQLAKAGQQRLAYEVLQLPSLVVDNRHEEVDRLVPGLLGAARDLQHRWLEVYVRHWNLQSRVLKRYEVKGLLPEAIELLDFANQDDTKTCPQSICVVQDLAHCYADTDGPAYGQERLDVAKETLSRIDPSWPCFRCISGEYASALLDMDRPQEALDFCHQQLVSIGASANPYDFRDSKVEALIGLGRYEEALAFNEDAENPGGGESWVLHKTIDQARLLTRLGRHEEALAALPEFDAIIDTPAYFSDWADAVRYLVKAQALENDWKLDLQLRVMAVRLEGNGALREAWHMNHLRAELSLARGRPWIAAHAVEALVRINGLFERPLDAPERTEQMKAKVDAAVKAAVIEIPESLEENLSEPSEPDLDYARLRIALQKWPNDARLWLGWSQSAGALGRTEEIVESGRAFAQQNPEAWQVAIVVGQTLVALGELDESDKWSEATFARIDNDESKASARFIQALAAERRGDREGMRARLETVLEYDPKARNSRAMLAALARERGDYDVALEHTNVLIEIEPDVATNHWDLIVAATIEERWDMVRTSAATLGIELASEEGAIEENWGICRVQLRDDTGTAFELHAVRTGPVTARVIEISAPELDDQYYGAAVVFDPRPLNPPSGDAPPADNDQQPDLPPLIFPLLEVLHASAHQAFAVDGARPSEAQLETFSKSVEALGVVIQVRSGGDYEIEHAKLGTREGAYWYVAVPEDAALEPIAEALQKLEGELDGPLVWPELARALDLTDELNGQKADIAAWKLM